MKFFVFSALLSAVAAVPTTGAAAVERGETLQSRQCSLSPSNPSTYWYQSIQHNGQSPFIPDGTNWPVYRNVRDFGAKGDGQTDDTAAIQRAINQGNSFADRTSDSVGTTGQPAQVYFPPGNYVVKGKLQLWVGTVLMGDPINRPSLLVDAGFNGGNTFIQGQDPHHDSTINFYIGMKNLVLDSTRYNKDKSLNLLDWTVSQQVQLSNVRFQMPYDSSGHVGLVFHGGSPLFLNDLYFHGGTIGIRASGQQYHFKDVVFDGCTTGIKVDNVFDFVVQGADFSLCGIGIDVTNNNVGTMVVIDSTVKSSGALVATGGSSTGQGSVVLENIAVTDTASTVTASGNVVKTGGVSGQAWVWGNAFTPGGPNTGAHQSGTLYGTSRPPVLVDNTGSYYTVPQPTYKEYDVSQFVNVKSVSGLPVKGDGSADDTKNLQTIINNNAGCKILFFPQGTYIVTDTLLFPVGSRVFGEAWSVISAKGNNFKNANSPRPVIQVGKPNDVGVAQFNDMMFTVAEVLPGAVLVEVNMAGNKAGDVGFWNTHVRIGGAAGSSVQTQCAGFAPASCKAAFMLMHLTSTSSAYVENAWLWTADHDLDNSSRGQTISVGRGMLVEATKGTWLLGMGIEHNTLYQANFDNAKNVFFGFQQSETPYWQGNGSPSLAPDPWSPLALSSDPDFSWCSGGDAQCRMALYLRISGSSNLNFYGGGFWTFFNGGNGCSGDCQTNAVLIQNTSKLYYFGVNTHLVSTLVRRNGNSLATSYYNPGGWGAGIAAYLTDSQ